MGFLLSGRPHDVGLFGSWEWKIKEEEQIQSMQGEILTRVSINYLIDWSMTHLGVVRDLTMFTYGLPKRFDSASLRSDIGRRSDQVRIEFL